MDSELATTPLKQDELEHALPTQSGDSSAVIRLCGVHKFYSRTERRADTLKESLLSALAQKARHDLVHALDAVDLAVGRGEAVGLIGPNGSGKSTLLKLVAGITQPTRGTVNVSGRVLGLIELGAGFHPDLTGDENVRLQGAIYGMEADEVERRLDAILDFAELREFRSMPVKHYSSGMFVRLGFAVAVHADPDVLLVDEVLSVGDLDFQERCMRKIRQLRRGGMTLLFVTHYPEQAESVCDRIVWLENGGIRGAGPALEVLADYHADLIASRYGKTRGPLDDKALAVGLPGRFGSGEARIEALRILDRDGRPRTNFRRGEALVIEIDYTAQSDVRAVDCMLPLYTFDGTMLTLWRAEREAAPSRPVEGRGRIRLEVPRLPLLPGRYGLTVSLTPPGRPYDHYDVLYKLFHFCIQPEPGWETVAPIELKAVAEGPR